MKLYFKDAKGKKKEVSKISNKEDVLDIIINECHNRGYEVKYIRFWQKEDRVTYDSGSHYEFFVLEGVGK